MLIETRPVAPRDHFLMAVYDQNTFYIICFDFVSTPASILRMPGDPPCSLDPSRTLKPRQTPKNRFFPGGVGGTRPLGLLNPPTCRRVRGVSYGVSYRIVSCPITSCRKGAQPPCCTPRCDPGGVRGGSGGGLGWVGGSWGVRTLPGAGRPYTAGRPTVGRATDYHFQSGFISIF